jgi:lipopolysaccharide transport system ATP-binding protein
MRELAIKAENISKQYRLGEVGTGTLSHDLNRFWYKVRGKEDPYLKVGEANDRTSKGESDYVWSLRDVNFEIERGDAVGIIGRNGAGKSTLLKLLSKVTKPTTGNFKVNGRIASLLEVGTGFNPEMTGRENIFLNGAILGMRRDEIKRKFDEIVAFSGVDRYIDTPVKRYSSGMYVRLAFAVAAHLESEILIVDEVLAVGDAEFQKKCLGKMGEVSKGEGRTVLFVSHNMAAVKSLCTKGIVLNKGIVEHQGDADSCVSLYLSGSGNVEAGVKSFDDVSVDGVFKLREIKMASEGSQIGEPLLDNKPVELTTTLEILASDASRYHLTYHLYNELGEPLFSFSHAGVEQLKTGINKLSCFFPAKFFQSGNYYLSMFIIADRRKSICVEKDIFAFTITDGGRDLGIFMGREPGYIKPKFEWKNQTI